MIGGVEVGRILADDLVFLILMLVLGFVILGLFQYLSSII